MTERKALCVPGLLPLLLLIGAIAAAVVTGRHLVILREARCAIWPIIPSGWAISDRIYRIAQN